MIHLEGVREDGRCEKNLTIFVNNAGIFKLRFAMLKFLCIRL